MELLKMISAGMVDIVVHRHHEIIRMKTTYGRSESSISQDWITQAQPGSKKFPWVRQGVAVQFRLSTIDPE